jgi:hypothetical protein
LLNPLATKSLSEV